MGDKDELTGGVRGEVGEGDEVSNERRTREPKGRIQAGRRRRGRVEKMEEEEEEEEESIVGGKRRSVRGRLKKEAGVALLGIK